MQNLRAHRTSTLQSTLGVILSILLSLILFTHPALAATHSLWSSTDLPAVSDSGDSSSTELGLRIIPSVNGHITGIKFYKDPLNTGVHIGNVWTRNGGGTNLATVTFTNESPSGWQTEMLPTPLPVTAGSEYVISYFAPNGHYSYTANYFSTGSYTNGPLSTYHDPLGGGSNGVYNYSSSSSFPDGNVGSPNYWVDVIFDDAYTPPDTTHPTVTINQASNLTDPSSVIEFTVVFSEEVIGFDANSVVLSGTTIGTVSNVIAIPTISCTLLLSLVQSTVKPYQLSLVLAR